MHCVQAYGAEPENNRDGKATGGGSSDNSNCFYAVTKSIHDGQYEKDNEFFLELKPNTYKDTENAEVTRYVATAAVDLKKGDRIGLFDAVSDTRVI